MIYLRDYMNRSLIKFYKENFRPQAWYLEDVQKILFQALEQFIFCSVQDAPDLSGLPTGEPDEPILLVKQERKENS